MVSKKSHSLSWHQEAAVTQLIEGEKKELEEILPTLYGYHLLLIGEAALAPLVDSSLITHQVLVNRHKQGAYSKLSYLQAQGESLPLKSESVDVVVLSHALEHTRDPHEMLREAHRVLIPEGHLVITGFNPFSLWGMWHVWKQLRGREDKKTKILTQARVQDWLHLLHFQRVKEVRFYFRPPIAPCAFYDKLAFLEQWGRRGWPFCAGAYIVVAVKRMIPLTPIRARWRMEKRFWHPVAAPQNLPKPTTKM